MKKQNTYPNKDLTFDKEKKWLSFMICFIKKSNKLKD